MKLSTKDFTTDRLWRSAVGMDAHRFHALLAPFKSAYIGIYSKTLAERRVGNDINYCIKDEEDLLLYLLFSLKSGLNYDLLGLVCGMSASNAKRNQAIGLEVLEKSLDGLDCMPKRKFMNLEEFIEFFKGHQDLILDATEQRIQRPGDGGRQKETYSGKKRQYPEGNGHSHHFEERQIYQPLLCR